MQTGMFHVVGSENEELGYCVGYGGMKSRPKASRNVGGLKYLSTVSGLVNEHLIGVSVVVIVGSLHSTTTHACLSQ